MTVVESILQFLQNAATYNRHQLTPPRIILWPDKE